MRKVFAWLFIVAIFTVVFSSCKEDFEKYENPDWLKGKLYTQLKATEDLDSFTVCVEKAHLDSVIDVSGLFTVFAPTNEAFQKFFQESPIYKKISDIPQAELERIVRYHMLQSSWTIAQLKTLDVLGWIDPTDPNNDKPWGYKRQTILRDDNKKYWTKFEKGEYRLTDQQNANTYRMVFANSRKYAPLFFDNFLSTAGITGDDYNYYFNSDYAAGKMHFAGARIIGGEIYAENGILYKVDELVVPLKNAEEILEQEYNGYSYSDFLSMIQRYGRLSPNIVETMKIPAFKRGEAVDTLYNLTFPELTFDIRNELTNQGSTPSTFTIRFHYGLVAPTNQALDELFSEVITGPNRWPDRGAVPPIIYKIIINSHMSKTPIYPKNISQGFQNGEADLVFFDPSTIIQTDYASNSTFAGVNKASVPRAFSSVAGPVYLRPGFSTFRTAMEITNILAAIKKENKDFAFFIVPDHILSQDSSLLISPNPFNPEILGLISLDRSLDRMVSRSKTDMAIQLFNQVGVTNPTGVGRKEFIPNLAGNYIVFDWENNIVSGGATSTFGYFGDSIIYITPQKLDEPTDNGSTYVADTWFTFPQGSMFTVANSYSEFSNLMKKAGLVDNLTSTLKFLSPGEYYTAFIPSNQAMLKYNTSTMTNAQIEQFVRYHFVKGDIIFTDGKMPSAQYPTLRVDESSTVYTKYFSNLNISPSVDAIDIQNPDGSLYYRVNEQSGTTNIMVADDMDPHSTRVNFVTTGVVHVIDTVLIK